MEGPGQEQVSLTQVCAPSSAPPAPDAAAEGPQVSEQNNGLHGPELGVCGLKCQLSGWVSRLRGHRKGLRSGCRNGPRVREAQSSEALLCGGTPNDGAPWQDGHRRSHFSEIHPSF